MANQSDALRTPNSHGGTPQHLLIALDKAAISVPGGINCTRQAGHTPPVVLWDAQNHNMWSAGEGLSRSGVALRDADRQRREAELQRQQADQQRLLAEQHAEQEKAAADAARAAAEKDRLDAERQRADADRVRAEAERARLDAESARAAAEAHAQQARSLAEQSEREKAQLREQLRVQLNTILETRETARGLVVNVSDVLFDFDSANLKPGAREKVTRIAEILRSHPDLKIQVEGHTDSVEADGYNLPLSERPPPLLSPLSLRSTAHAWSDSGVSPIAPCRRVRNNQCRCWPGTFSPSFLPYGDACSNSEFNSAPTRSTRPDR
jgi:outer membrane protein OmpA-like peptidoglycan-associated protein